MLGFSTHFLALSTISARMFADISQFWIRSYRFLDINIFENLYSSRLGLVISDWKNIGKYIAWTS